MKLCRGRGSARSCKTVRVARPKGVLVRRVSAYGHSSDIVRLPETQVKLSIGEPFPTTRQPIRRPRRIAVENIAISLEQPTRLSARAYGPRNSMKISHGRVIIHDSSERRD